MMRTADRPQSAALSFATVSVLLLWIAASQWTPPAVDADVVVLAGDIHVGIDGMPWARAHFGDTPIIYVAGNHEFYGHELEAELHRLGVAARSHDIELLDGNQVLLGGVRFLGATLWTDFETRRAFVRTLDPHRNERSALSGL